jgi:ribonuclease P/MRP protein subunit RPP40
VRWALECPKGPYLLVVIGGPEDRDKLQEALDCLCDWADKWGMSFNVSKCKVMHVGRNNPEYEYTMRGQKLETTDEERDIGVMITKNLKPSAQSKGIYNFLI